MDTAYSFDDIILTPQYSTLRSRSEADTSFKFWEYTRKIPIITANMETVTGTEMAIKMWELGGIGALHRFWSIDENVEAFKKIKESFCDAIVSVGVNEKSRDRAKALFDAGARMFVVDIAHGHSIMMKETVEWLKSEFRNSIFIIAGNVATYEAARDLYSWGADCVKTGVGQGSVCTTRVVTGHGYPSFSSIQEVASCSKALGKLMIADGGMKSSGDMVKAIVAGADCVMIGGLVSGTDECPGDVIDGKYKIYKGSASYERGPKIAKEGILTKVPYKGPVEHIINDLEAGFRSGMSYSNARTLQDLSNARYNIQTSAGYAEGLPHMRKG